MGCMSRYIVWWSCQSPVAHCCGLLNHPNSFHGGMFKLHARLDADSLLYLLSHFECDSHTVHMLTEWHLPSPLTSTVKSSLFTHVHSSLPSLAAGYIDVTQMVLVILTRLDFFQTDLIYLSHNWWKYTLVQRFWSKVWQNITLSRWLRPLTAQIWCPVSSGFSQI